MSSVFSLLQPWKKTSTKVVIDGINNGGLKVDGGLNESWGPQRKLVASKLLAASKLMGASTKVGGLSSASRAAAAVPCCGLTANILSHSKQLGRLTRKLASPIVSRKSSLVASSQAHNLAGKAAAALPWLHLRLRRQPVRAQLRGGGCWLESQLRQARGEMSSLMETQGCKLRITIIVRGDKNKTGLFWSLSERGGRGVSPNPIFS